MNLHQLYKEIRESLKTHQSKADFDELVGLPAAIEFKEKIGNVTVEERRNDKADLDGLHAKYSQLLNDGEKQFPEVIARIEAAEKALRDAKEFQVTLYHEHSRLIVQEQAERFGLEQKLIASADPRLDEIKTHFWNYRQIINTSYSSWTSRQKSWLTREVHLIIETNAKEVHEATEFLKEGMRDLEALKLEPLTRSEVDTQLNLWMGATREILQDFDLPPLELDNAGNIRQVFVIGSEVDPKYILKFDDMLKRAQAKVRGAGKRANESQPLRVQIKRKEK